LIREFDLTSLGYVDFASGADSRATVDGITNTSYYKYLMIVITKIATTNQYGPVQINELEYYGIPEYDPDAHGTDVIVRSVPNVPNTDWLEVYYDAKDLANGTITTVDDLTPSGTNDGTPTDVNVSDGAFVFNGTSSRISGSITQDAGAYAHSVSIWFYTNDELSELTEANKYLFEIGDGSTNSSPGIHFSDTNRIYVSFLGNYVYVLEASTYIQSKNWTHVSYTYDGGPLTLNNPALYINGTRIGFDASGGSSNGSALSLGSNPQLRVGCDANNAYVLNGKIANFRLFNRALTGDEVWQLYAYQKEYFNVSPDVVTFKGGRLGIGTSEPRAVLDVRGDILGGCPVYFAAHATDYRYAKDGGEIIRFDTVEVSKGGGYDSSDGVFTVPLAGIYKFHFYARAHGTTALYARVVINGVEQYPGLGQAYILSSSNMGSLTAMYALNVGDTVAINLRNDSAGRITNQYNGFIGQYISSL